MLISPLPNRPIYRITQKFGQNDKDYGAPNDHVGHNGIDFAPRFPGQKGYLVYAPHDGYLRVGYDPDGYGNYVEITSLAYNDAGHRRLSILAHLEQITKPNGAWVGAGDSVGIMGTTGWSSGVHLHWTYKVLDEDGGYVYPNNGYNGAIDIGPKAVQWINYPIY